MQSHYIVWGLLRLMIIPIEVAGVLSQEVVKILSVLCVGEGMYMLVCVCACVHVCACALHVCVHVHVWVQVHVMNMYVCCFTVRSCSCNLDIT